MSTFSYRLTNLSWRAVAEQYEDLRTLFGQEYQRGRQIKKKIGQKLFGAFRKLLVGKRVFWLALPTNFSSY